MEQSFGSTPSEEIPPPPPPRTHVNLEQTPVNFGAPEEEQLYTPEDFLAPGSTSDPIPVQADFPELQPSPAPDPKLTCTVEVLTPYFQTYQGKELFEGSFEFHPTPDSPLFTPPLLDTGYAARAESALSRELDGLLRSAQGRGLAGVGPLLTLQSFFASNILSDSVSETDRTHLQQCVTLAMLACGQATGAISYTRRLNILGNIWGKSNLSAARLAIKTAGDKGVFRADPASLFPADFKKSVLESRDQVATREDAVPAPLAPRRPFSRFAPYSARGRSSSFFRGSPARSRGYGRRYVNTTKHIHTSPNQTTAIENTKKFGSCCKSIGAYNTGGEKNGKTNFSKSQPKEYNSNTEPLNKQYTGDDLDTRGSHKQYRECDLSWPFYGLNEKIDKNNMDSCRHVQGKLEKIDPESGNFTNTKRSPIRIYSRDTTPSKFSNNLQNEQTRSTNNRSNGQGTKTNKYSKHMLPTQTLRRSVYQTQKQFNRVQTDRRSVKAESINHLPSFQNGRITGCPKSNVTKLCNDQNRSISSLLLGSHPRTIQTVHGFSMGERDFEFQQNVFRYNISPETFYQTPPPNHGIPSGTGDSNSGIYRRFFNRGSEQKSERKSHTIGNNTVDRIGVLNKPEKMYTRAHTRNRIPGHDIEFERNDSEASRTESNTNKITGDFDTRGKQDLNKGTGVTDRISKCIDASISHGSTFLQEPPINLHSEHTGTEHRTIKITNPAKRSSKGRITVLGSQCDQLTTISHTNPKRVGTKNLLRCLPEGLGSPDERTDSSRGLVKRRPESPHQCTRTKGSRECHKTVLPIPEIKQDSTNAGQYHSNSLHQQKRRNEEQVNEHNNKESMAILPEQQPGCSSGTYPGDTQHHSRPPVTAKPGNRNERLVVENTSIRPNKPTQRTIKEGPLCRTLEHKMPKFLPLAKRRTEVQGCIQNNLDPGGLCFSPILINRESASESTRGPILDLSSSTNMANTELVQHIVEPSSGKTTKTANTARFLDGLPRELSSSPPEGFTIGGMEYFRLRVEAQGFSKSVSETLESSWSTGTKSRYNCGWNHWLSWCRHRNYNPFLSDLTIIADFLVHKANQGCSYSYLNNLRSMFSAYLPKLNGNTIGKHEIICKLMQAFWNNNPPQARYSTTWDIELVLDYWNKQPVNPQLSLLNLSIKAVTLTAISSLGRAADIQHLSINNYKLGNTPSGSIKFIEFLRLAPPKQQRKGILQPVRIFATHNRMPNICPVNTLTEYLGRTKNLRPSSVENVFIISRQPFTAVSAKTVSRWILTSMQKAGIDTSTYKAHSICGAAASKYKKLGFSYKDLLRKGRWRKASTIKSWYTRNIS